MNKFFLITRGRTGSTAVVDELNKCTSLCATQELFLALHFSNIQNKKISKLFDLVLPVIFWKRKFQTANTPNKKYNIYYDLIAPFIRWKQAHRFWKWIPSILNIDNIAADQYLNEAESLAELEGAASFGFKVLSHQLDERPFLSELLKQRAYHAIYLTRNITRQVLSGMVAAQRGFYNTQEKFKDERRYQIDLDEFQWLVQWEIQSVEKDIARLKGEKFDYIVVSYEEFTSNRQAFYEKIFDFLGLPTELPPNSDWSIVIKDLRYTIANYDAVVERAAAIGMPLDI